ncbi:hypothetical protein ORJ04_02325 [Rheinheimera baltica]|uniref:HDOD domain-containing protein n=1 Tax=Rheinheimera baltica TaxID=67576 RepID=A0ABT9HUH8_9GAMM|nr:hypothetical protein [Rheinheimera baltica]MDP5134779.1 hypothetical protein [Rheinheimera baltica]
MTSVNAVLQQVQLLLDQRLQLVLGRYTSLKQLQQHDRQLIDCARLLLPADPASALPAWAMWLCGNNHQTVLNLSDTQDFVFPEAAWLLLKQLKVRLFPQLDAMQLMMPEADTQLAPLHWQLANSLQLTLNPFTHETGLSAASLWYLGGSAQLQLLPSLLAFKQQLATDAPLQLHIELAMYLWGQKSDETRLCEKLLGAEQLTAEQLMVLIVGAAEPAKASMINLLARTEANMALAMMSMGFSGQLKFVPLLAELAQQSSSKDVAISALDMLLGVMATDSLLAEPKALQRVLLQRHSSRQICGEDMSEPQLAHLWRSGNQLQRQLVACYRCLAQANIPLLNTHSLLGAV